MSEEIKEARARHLERKRASGASNTKAAEGEMARRPLVGLDIDLDEIMAIRNDIITAPMEALLAGVPVHEVLLGMWVDGLAVGVDMEKKRDGS